MPKDETLEAKLKRLRLFGLLARIDEVRKEPWLDRVLALEDEEKTRRSLAHRVHLAGINAFKPLADFDWKWPGKIDRAQIEALCTLDFIAEGANVVMLGPNGVGETMLLRNIAHRALHDGRAVVVRRASDLLADLVKQESSAARAPPRGIRLAPSALHRRGRLPLVRRAAGRPVLRGRLAPLRQWPIDPAHDEQAVRRVADDLTQRRVRGDPGPIDSSTAPRSSPSTARATDSARPKSDRSRRLPHGDARKSERAADRYAASADARQRRRRTPRSSVIASETGDRFASSAMGALARDRSDSSHRRAQD